MQIALYRSPFVKACLATWESKVTILIFMEKDLDSTKNERPKSTIHTLFAVNYYVCATRTPPTLVPMHKLLVLTSLRFMGYGALDEQELRAEWLPHIQFPFTLSYYFDVVVDERTHLRK